MLHPLTESCQLANNPERLRLAAATIGVILMPLELPLLPQASPSEERLFSERAVH
jgi:hypothetical protein